MLYLKLFIFERTYSSNKDYKQKNYKSNYNEK